MRIVFLSGRYIHAGRHRKWAGVSPSARHAELAAAFADRGHTPVLVADPAVHLPEDIARLVWRHDPHAVVVCGDSIPPAVVAALRSSPVPIVVTTATDPSGGGEVHQADLPGVLAATGAGAGISTEAYVRTRSQVVPPALRAEVGIEVARRDPDGIVRSNDPDVIAQTIEAAQQAVAESSGPLPLHGLEDLAADKAVTLLAAVSERLQSPAAGLSLRVQAAVANQSIAAAAAPLAATVCLLVNDQADVDALRQAIATFEHSGLDVTVYARFGQDIEIVEDVAGIVLSSGVELSYVWLPGTSPSVVADGDRILAETGSATLGQQAAIGPVGAMAALLSGRFDSGPASGAVDAILVTGDVASGEIRAAGLRTEVFSTSGAIEGNGRPWVFDAGDLAGDGEVRLDGLTFEMSGYRHGRHVTPFDSMVLRFGDLDDIEAFLADADIARGHGRFPAALLSGFTLLADACAWGPAGECHCGQLRRAACDDGVHIRTAPHGPMVGDIDQPWSLLARTARQEMAAAKRRRGCQDCPIAALCSKDLCLSSLIADEQYCRHRQARPWLVCYLDAIDAIRKVRRDPAQVVPTVGGFGGTIHDVLADGSWPDRPALVLMEWQGGFYGYTPSGDQAFRLTPDTAFIAEALLVHSEAGDASRAIENRFRLSPEQAAVAMRRVRRLLAERGAEIVPVVSARQIGVRS
jgi:hypothetical protein